MQQQQQTDDRLIEIQAAWEVWSEILHEVRRVIHENAWHGDMTAEFQRAELGRQLRVQCLEAYARGRIQAAIVTAIDGAAANDDDGRDQFEQFEQHWRETWGEQIAIDAAAYWRDKYDAAKARAARARASRAALGTPSS